MADQNVPANLRYTEDHEWILVDGNSATIGITAHAQSELGDIVFVEIETEGEEVAQGEVFGTIEAVKTVSDLFMPSTATVTEFNSALEDDPELVNRDPYGEGWMIKAKLADVESLEKATISAEEYLKLIGA